jgi:tetraacyldisaccharide-1-P 4'-kinase
MFAQQAKFKNGEVLPAGEYRMEVSKNSQTPEVKFYKIYTGTYESQIEVGDKAVASVKATVVTEPTKNQKTEVLSESHGNIQVVKSILPAGWNERLVFSSAEQKSL